MSKRAIAIIGAVVLVVVLVLVFALPFTQLRWGIGPWVIGAGPIITDEHPLAGFNRVEVSSAIELEITRSQNYSITVTGYENLVQRLDVELSGQRVIIGLERGRYLRNNVRAVITMPDLEGLVVSGASDATAAGFTSAGEFDLEVSGASRVDIEMESGRTAADVSGASRLTGEIQAQDIRLTVSGASRCELAGSAVDMDLNVSGASRVNLLQFEVEGADVGLSGASWGTVNVTGTLDVELSGASSLQYTGDPDLASVEISGASRMSEL